ncbi:MAG: hypothetical protein NTZ21_06395 [Actinobacteria bacterium]|nr:hypothetical protein [Actinomycetota bacterium]
MALGVDRFWGRLLVYAVSATGGSVIGSTFTRNSSWVEADPWTAGPWTALFTLGPAIGVAALAPLRGRALAFVSLCLATAMLAMWWLFASSERSTAALVFGMGGWIVGIPISGVLVVVASRFSASRATGTARSAKHRRDVHR